MNLANHLDSTYLKTDEQSGLSSIDTKQKVISLVEEAIENEFKLVMIRSKFIPVAKRLIADAKSKVLVGTVIGFHEGTYSLESKLNEAKLAIESGVDELDYVINYEEFIKGNVDLVENEVIHGTKIGLNANKVVKWIIEIAALNNNQIVAITKLIRNTVIANFGNENAKNVFVKSSTGFYKTESGKPNGATFEAMKLIIQNAKPLYSKAAGGVKTYNDAAKMIEMGVERIGTSSAKKIMDGELTEGY